jgi:hypothetical protein
MEDSTAQAIGYWDKKEKQSYTVSTEKYKVNGNDTTHREFIQYDIDVTVTDSTATSYTIEWLYKNIQVKGGEKLVQKLASISENLNVVIKTNEMGVFQEVVNWKDVQRAIKEALSVLKKEFKDVPKIDALLNPIEARFISKEGIEANAITEIQQYYTFHGARYTLNEELSAKIQLPNNFGGSPIDADLTLRLDELNPDDNNYIIRYWQVADAKQITDASYEFIKRVAAGAGQKPPDRSTVPDITHEETVSSRIHGSGWVIYSIRTKTVTTGDVSNIEEMIIEIK